MLSGVEAFFEFFQHGIGTYCGLTRIREAGINGNLPVSQG